MEFFKSRKTAAVVLVLCIVAGVFLGQVRKPSNPAGPTDRPDVVLNPSSYEKYLSDQVGVLSRAQKDEINEYNARWDAACNVTAAFVSVRSISGSLDDYAYDRGAALGLDEMDLVLLYVSDQDSYYVAPGDDLSRYITNSDANRMVTSLNDSRIPFGEATMDFYKELDAFLDRNFSTAPSAQNRGGSVLASVIMVVVILLIVLLIMWVIEQSRFEAYRRRYYGVANPTVVYRPVFFWHRPGSAWYRRHWRPVPPPPPRTPPSGGNRRPPSGGTGGFGGTRRPPTGTTGGFGGTRSGGSFGGSRSSFGGSRGGSFGGSRGGGFGGSRGGGFGGRR